MGEGSAMVRIWLRKPPIFCPDQRLIELFVKFVGIIYSYLNNLCYYAIV